MASLGPKLTPISKILNAALISKEHSSDRRYDITLSGPVISAIDVHKEEPLSDDPHVIDARGCLVGPSLCHAHIHLDKCFILNDEKFADLEIQRGDFKEALELTAKAKKRFQEDDLLRRGQWLIQESITFGVTHMRAFVEVDSTVEYKCLDAAIKLKERFQGACEIQICLFAQDPIFSGDSADQNRDLLLHALPNPAVEVLGTTPYVEDGDANSRRNIEWAVSVAIRFQKHLDLHLDYFLDIDRPPQMEIVIQTVLDQQWNEKSHKHITLGHCTRQTRYTEKDWRVLSEYCRRLPISLVGLPSSDLFIMGKKDQESSFEDRVRGTLQVPHLIRHFGIHAAIAINNVGNAFTPYGSCDPLALASMGIGIYQAGTKQDAILLHDCITVAAKQAIGIESRDQSVGVKDPADLVIYEEASSVQGNRNKERTRSTVHHLVCDPPRQRKTIFRGNAVEI